MNNELYIPDYHLHTCFSGDCSTPVMDVIAAARKKGMRSICITDHNDHAHPPLPCGTDFNLKLEDYFPYMTSLRDSLKDFDLRIGIEQGLMPSVCDTLSSFSKEHPELDFIICSTHFIAGYDPYYPEFWQEMSTIEGCSQYFKEMLYTVEHFTDYCVYGHLDYIFRYAPEPVTDLSPYMELIEAILKNIIKNDKGIEINTGSLYRGMDYAHPHEKILRLYKELGGEILTFGSDAHDTEHIGHSFKEISEYVSQFGFKGYYTYKKLKPEFHAFS